MASCTIYAVIHMNATICGMTKRTSQFVITYSTGCWPNIASQHRFTLSLFGMPNVHCTSTIYRSTSEENLTYLRALTARVTDACKIKAGTPVISDAAPLAGTQTMENVLSFDAYLPSGFASYPAIGVQDYTMIFFGGAVPLENGFDHLRLFVGCQNDTARRIENDAAIPAGAIPHHVRLDGRPVSWDLFRRSGVNHGVCSRLTIITSMLFGWRISSLLGVCRVTFSTKRSMAGQSRAPVSGLCRGDRACGHRDCVHHRS